MNYSDWLPPEALHIILTLFLSFLIGLEREERKEAERPAKFGGVRTFPLIGLIGYAVALVSRNQILPQVIGFAVVAGFLMISYSHKLAVSGQTRIATEMSALTTYLVGALVSQDLFWIATTLTVLSVFLLELKAALESLATRIDANDILTFATFLLLAAVILPLLPNSEMTQFSINPFKTWLIVVAVSGVSYAFYLLQRLTKSDGGVLLAAVIGGTYSSTVTTIALAKRSRGTAQPRLFSGGIVIASGMMYGRVAVLLALFNDALAKSLGLPLLGLAALAVAAGVLWSRSGEPVAGPVVIGALDARNPLEVRAALLFAALFVAMQVATHLAVSYLGRSGVYALSAIMGLADVDPFIVGMTQSTPGATPVQIASTAILIAVAANNVSKGVYALIFADRDVGVASLLFLLGLSLLGLVPLWLYA